jgi:hypothetical protein
MPEGVVNMRRLCVYLCKGEIGNRIIKTHMSIASVEKGCQFIAKHLSCHIYPDHPFFDITYKVYPALIDYQKMTAAFVVSG